jgi:peptidoglycan/LPS O-acetylase OafA/YrhL
MGLLRFFLSISVVIVHAGPILGVSLVNGVVAVQSFFIISGFYMSIILNEKYIGNNNSYFLFITNRMLRLYPLYLIILLISILVFSLFTFLKLPNPLSSFFNYPLGINELVFLIFSQILILGQDITLFFGVDQETGSMFFKHDLISKGLMAWNFMLIPPAWSISIEIMFYIIAPFILKGNQKTFFLVAFFGSASIRILLYYYGFQKDPWTYRFFPTEVFFFLLGGISYKIFRRLKGLKITSLHFWMAQLSLIILMVSFPFFPSNKLFMPIFYTIIIISIPILSLKQFENKSDRFIGELSYPIYLSHFLLWVLVKSVLNSQALIGFVTVVVTVLFSFFLNHVVMNPIEKIRHKRLRLAQ